MKAVDSFECWYLSTKPNGVTKDYTKMQHGMPSGLQITT